jgi:hypothetical protein
LALSTALNGASGAEASDPWSFAAHLASGGDAANAAIEFRRIALRDGSAATRGAAYWYSAHEYWRLQQTDISGKMLDCAEDIDPGLASQVALLRAENARVARSWDEAAFHYQSVLRGKPSREMRAYAARNLAAAEVWKGSVPGAREALRLDGTDTCQAALDAFDRGRDRSPFVGGLLGLVPGLGYAYSGEYANALRSLLLNALFGFGLCETASREQWGPFAAIGFFEATWYSGSVYGGVDAAYRYNLNRRVSCDGALRGNAAFEPDWAELPLVQLRFRF